MATMMMTMILAMWMEYRAYNNHNLVQQRTQATLVISNEQTMTGNELL